MKTALIMCLFERVASFNKLQKVYILLTSTLLLSITTSCTTAEINAYNEGLKHSMDWAHNPENREEILFWYNFALGSNPYETFSMIERPSRYLFNRAQCFTSQFNDAYQLNKIAKQNVLLGPYELKGCESSQVRQPAQVEK